jgi:hypothetical protein
MTAVAVRMFVKPGKDEYRAGPKKNAVKTLASLERKQCRRVARLALLYVRAFRDGGMSTRFAVNRRRAQCDSGAASTSLAALSIGDRDLLQESVTLIAGGIDQVRELVAMMKDDKAAA